MQTQLNIQSITDAVRAFVIDNFLFGRGEQLRDDESLLDLGIIDSTGILELIQFVEISFGIKVEDRETIPQNLDGVANIAQYVSSKLNATV